MQGDVFAVFVKILFEKSRFVFFQQEVVRLMICLSTLKSIWTGQRKIRLVLQTKTTDEYMPQIMLTEHEFITGKRHIMRRDIKLSIVSYECQYS